MGDRSVTADYVIVGAGSAGCVLAEALSTRHSVVIMEAGGTDRSVEVAIPAAFSKLFLTDRDWGFQSEPEPGASERSLFLPRGKMLGGSSSMNAMLYMRGRQSDYDAWEAAGAVGWGWADVLPVFIAMESNSRGASPHHGVSGPVLVGDIDRPNLLSRVFVEAAMTAGIHPNPDFNGARQEGVGFFQVTQRRGRRWSAADAFLRPALGRPTLEVIPGAHVTRVLIEKGRSVGVEFTRDSTTERIEANAEVILCAGAFGSPQLLQLSGIGDPTHLRSVGVEPIVDSPQVGQSLQDHPVAPVIFESLYSGTLDDAENSIEKLKWLLTRRGRLTSPVAEACAFVRSNPELEEPDLQYHFGPVNFDNHGLQPYTGHAFTLGAVLINPKSRGSVLIRSEDPSAPPAIRVNCLAENGDLEALVSGVEMAREITAQTPFDPFRGVELKPGPGFDDKRNLERYVRDNVELLYHPVGTCRMGADDGAVVDPLLRVKGVDGLRVADASVMPTVVSGNTNAPTMMIASRASAMILAG